MMFLKNSGIYFIFLLMIIFNISCNQNLVSDAGWELVGSGFNFPEGPAWDMKETLYVSNCYGDWMAKVQHGRIDTFVTASDTTFQKTNGLYVGKQGDLFACDFGQGSIVQISPTGKFSTLMSGYKGELFNRPNDLVLDQDGNIFFTDPKSYGVDKEDGRVFYYDVASGNLTLAADSLAFPNGIGISPVDGHLYVCESAKNRIIRFERSEPGILKNKHEFIRLPGGDPDGIDFDMKGNMYVAHFGTGTVFIISPKGEILKTIKTPGMKPTNLEFGGTGLKTLYLTEVETNSLYKIAVKYAGFK